MSFFDKFRKEVNNEKTEEVEKEEIEKSAKKKTKKADVKKDSTKIAEEKQEFIPPSKKNDKEWFDQEGQLAVDVFQTNNEIFVQSAIAGVSVQDIDITVENDMVVIRGDREKPTDIAPTSGKKDYFYQECYWGPFSRQIILPAEVDNSKIEAIMKNGILTIKIPKLLKEQKKRVSIKSKDEE
jgi:HSP20 family protein